MGKTGVNMSWNKCKNWWLILIFLFASRQSSLSSLVISLYHNETMYIAGDSAATMYANGERTHTVQKVYPFSDTCCAAITGFVGYDLTNSAGKTNFSMSLSDALARACARQMTNAVSLEKKIELITFNMHEAYARYYDLAKNWAGQTNASEDTMLQFVGYDTDKEFFFVRSCKLDRTNALRIKLTKEYHGANDTTPFTLQGEVTFLQTLLSGEKPELTHLISDKFTATAEQLASTEPVSDSSVTNFILEMYSLHVANSARLGYSQGWVGTPYHIFKITKKRVTDLTPEQSAGTKYTSSAIPSHASDDKEIDVVMEKLEKTFLDNDYSYAFEVIYAPIMEAMGGKEKLLAAVPVLKEQMKQQQLIMISWKPQKPYSYLKKDAGWYAVIPYVSEMTMAGQKVKVTGFQLGIKDDGSPWGFVTGDNLTPEMLNTYFPDFPKDFELPKTQRQIK